jgi:MFS family permease
MPQTGQDSGMTAFGGITSLRSAGTVRAWTVASVLGIAQLCVLFDSLAVATALPAIGAHFDLAPGELQWVVSLFSISAGSFMLLGGRACDVLGARRVLMGSLAVCALGGVLTGAAPSVAVLLAGRVLQGVAAAAALPAALSLAASSFEREPWRSRVYSVIATAAWLAAVAGAVLGGLITDAWGWRWVFLVTVPAAVGGLVGCRAVPSSSPAGTHRRSLDVAGTLLAAGAVGALLLGVEQLARREHVVGVTALVAALAALVAFLRVEHGSDDPLLPPALLRSRLVGSCVAFGAYCAGYTALVVVGSLFVQSEYGLGATGAGLFLTPMLVVGTVSAVLAPRLVRRHGVRRVTTAALVSCAAAMLGLALSRPQDPAFLLPWLVLWGAGSGPVFVGLTREVLGDVGPHESGTVAAMFESMSHVGGGVAAALYLMLLGAGFGFAGVQASAAAVVAVGAGLALWSLARRAAGQDLRRRSA